MDSAEQFMQQALELARRGLGRTSPNPAVGAVVVSGGEVVGSGFHPAAGMPHAEIYALRDAGQRARGADLYVTLEPCSHMGKTPPCADAIIRAGVARVFVGCQDPNLKVHGAGLARLNAAGIATHCGVLEEECRRLIAPFAQWMRTGRPLVTLKAALTLDGWLATASGDSRWISNEMSRLRVHQLRNEVDAIMVGAGTVLKDDPLLTTRLPEGGHDALRVIVDRDLETPETARLFHSSSEAGTLILTSERASEERAGRLRAQGAEVVRLADVGDALDMTAVLMQLGRRGVQHVLVEGGSRLNASLWRAGLVNRLMLFIAPKILGGGDGVPLFAGVGVPRMAEALPLSRVRMTPVEDDVLIEGDVACSPA